MVSLNLKKNALMFDVNKTLAIHAIWPSAEEWESMKGDCPELEEAVVSIDNTS